MKLHAAAALAAKFAGKEAPFDQVSLGDGTLAATNGVHSVVISCPESKLPVTVTAADLVSVGAALNSSELRATKTTLVVEGSGSKYTLRRRTDRLPDLSSSAEGCIWRDLTPAEAALLAAGAGLAEDNKVQPQLSGLRLTPQWFGAATLTHVWVVWAGLVHAPITVDPAAVRRLSPSALGGGGSTDLAIRDGDVTAYTKGLAGDYPDATIESLISAQRARDGRAMYKLNVAELRALCAVAAATQVSPADLFAFHVQGSTATLRRAAQDDRLGYEGSRKCVEPWTSDDAEAVGVSPTVLHRLLDLCVGDGPYYLALGGPSVPVVIWGGEPAVEIVISPGYLPA